MTPPPDMTVEQYFELLKMCNPDVHRVICAGSQSEFGDAVALAVRNCLEMLEDRRKVLAKASELLLSTALADLLTRSGLRATAETHVNGHVDLVINDVLLGRYRRMLGECKFDEGPKHLCDGANQLLGYCSGAEKRAMVIGFCREPDVTARVENLRQHFDDVVDCHRVSSTKDHHDDIPWSFVALHYHQSGTIVEILYLACNLHVPA